LEWYTKHIPILRSTIGGKQNLANDCYNDGVEIFPSNPDLLEKLFVAIILKYLMKKELSGPNEEGYVVLQLPLPPGSLLDLWQDNRDLKQVI
jgi:propionyl-CoA synthetase